LKQEDMAAVDPIIPEALEVEAEAESFHFGFRIATATENVRMMVQSVKNLAR